MRIKGWQLWGIWVVMGLFCLSPAWAMPTDFEVADHQELAEEYMVNKQWDYASFEWRRILEVDAANIKAHTGLAETLKSAGFPKDAIRHMEKAVVAVKSPALLIRLAELYEGENQMQQAFECYQLVFEVSDADGVALRGIQRVMPKLPETLQDSARSLLNTQAAIALKKAKTALLEKNYRRAANFLDVASLVYDDPATLNDWAISRFLNGQAQPALETLQTLQKASSPATPEIRANLAMVTLSLGGKDLAATQLEQLIPLCANPALKAKLYNNLGYVYEQSRNWTMAAGAYRQAIQSDSTLMKAYLNLGYVYQRQREYRQAISLYEGFLKKFPGNANVLNQLGFAYEMDYRYKRAVSSYLKSIGADPLHRDAYFNLATVYRKLGKVDDANTILTRMTDSAFDAMETAMADRPKNPDAETSPLFKVIDVFFSPNTTQQAYVATPAASVSK